MSHDAHDRPLEIPSEVNETDPDTNPKRERGAEAPAAGAPLRDFYQCDDSGQITAIVSCVASTESIKTYA